MAKLTDQSLLKGMRGRVGDIVVRKIGGRLFVSLRPARPGKRDKRKPTPAQVAHRKRFQAASRYAEKVQCDATLHAFYAPFAKARGLRVRAVALSDFFHPPKVESIDLRRYRGRAGDPIVIRARDEFGVVRVNVLLRDATGAVLEQGEAQLRARRWLYQATQSLAAGQSITIEALAYDRPKECGALKIAWPEPR